MNVVYLSYNGNSTNVLPVPLEVVGYGCGVSDINVNVVSDETYKRRPNNQNDVKGKINTTTNKNDGKTDKTSDETNYEIMPSILDELMADGNNNTDITVDNNARWKKRTVIKNDGN